MRLRLLIIAGVIAAGVLAAVATVASGGKSAAATPGCPLGRKGNSVQHVIYVVFDNTHFRRDVPNVPSDLEQMPHLLNFITGNGTLQSNHHTILISHTAGGILSSMTGLYPDRNGITVSNSYDYYKANPQPTFTSAFKYWTDTVDGADDSAPNMVGDGGQTTPPPWLPFTAAGCNVGGVSAANIELENANTSTTGDIARVYGTASPEFAEAGSNPAKAQADFVGIALHCSKNASPCFGNQHARPDDETTVPGSNNGYTGLFGAAYVNPAITNPSSPCVNDLSGQPIEDPNGNCGFPGFDSALAKNSLGEVAQMQEHGVPVTFAYISDAHDNHALARASGPGEADYKQQLADYDAAFNTFFQRLAADGINKSNTLFVFTADEGDHFAGGTGSPDPNNPGALTYTHLPCSNLSACPADQIGEITTNLKGVLSDLDPSVTTGYDIHFDDAPTFYVNGNPNRSDPTVRQLEQDAAKVTGPDPYASAPGSTVPLAQRLADTVEEKTLHMIDNDPKRTPTFTFFGNADFFFQLSNSNTCGGTFRFCVDPKFAWNHGDYQDEIANNWLGMVGPGVQHNGVDSKTWSDHTDDRPTMLSILGLQDGYQDDGRVLMQNLTDKAISKELNQHEKTNQELADIDKQLNAPFGAFGLATLESSTLALRSTDPLVYDSLEAKIATLTQQRDDLAGAIRSALDGTEFRGEKLDESQAKAWIDQATGPDRQGAGTASLGGLRGRGGCTMVVHPPQWWSRPQAPPSRRVPACGLTRVETGVRTRERPCPRRGDGRATTRRSRRRARRRPGSRTRPTPSPYFPAPRSGTRRPLPRPLPRRPE